MKGVCLIVVWGCLLASFAFVAVLLKLCLVPAFG